MSNDMNQRIKNAPNLLERLIQKIVLSQNTQQSAM